MPAVSDSLRRSGGYEHPYVAAWVCRGQSRASKNSKAPDPREPGTTTDSNRSYWVARYAAVVPIATAVLTPIMTRAHPGLTVPRPPDPAMSGPNTRGTKESWKELNPNTRTRKLALAKVILRPASAT